MVSYQLTVMCFICPTGFHKYITHTYIHTFLSSTPFFFYSFPPLPYLFHQSYLPSVFIRISLRSFLSLSPISLHPFHMYSIVSLSLSPHTIFFTFHPIPVISLRVSTSKSRHHFSFSCTLSAQVLRNFLCHTPLMLSVVSGFFDSFPSFLLVCVLVLFTQLYIHPSFFCF
jgi:hypothetical protein